MDHVKRKALIVELPVLIFVLFIGWKLRSRNFYYVMDISEILILTAVLKIMPLLELSVNDLTAVASFMLANKVVLQFLYIPEYKHSRIIPFTFLLLLELFVLIRGAHHRKKGYGIAIGHAVLCCMVVLYVYQKFEQSLFLNYLIGGVTEGFVGKILCFLLGIAVAAVSILLIIRYFSVFIKKWLIKLQEYSMTYTEIDRSIMLVMILTLCCLMMTELLPFVPEDNTYEFQLLWIGLCIIIVMIQVVYIRLLVKSISVKEEMRLQEKDLHQLAEYNHELEKNMEDMRGIRHDIKNLFLTMGGFVDRSSDEEMKVFYEENIVPFTKQELQKNDLYVKLAGIHDESLKSFLYFKIMQGIEQNVPMDLRIRLAGADDIFCIGQIDLIRILGILIDNAVEEAKSCNGTVVISMKENKQEYLFSVSNTVRQQTREKGVVAGTTDKGLGRGSGLLIADKLIRKYKNVLLNSFFMENEFVQCLRIEK